MACRQYSKDVAKENGRALTFIEEQSSELSELSMVPILGMYDLETGKHVRITMIQRRRKENLLIEMSTTY